MSRPSAMMVGPLVSSATGPAADAMPDKGVGAAPPVGAGDCCEGDGADAGASDAGAADAGELVAETEDAAELDGAAGSQGAALAPRGTAGRPRSAETDTA